MRHPLPAIATPALLAVLLLSGCTAGTGGGAATGPAASGAPATQTTAEACAAAEDAVTGTVDAFQQIDPADPAAAAEAFSEMSASLETAAAAVSDSEVSQLLPRLQRGFSEAAEVMADIAGGDLGRVGDLSGPTGEITDAFGAFGELCR